MRHLAVFLLAACSIFAADFSTGQAARLVLGQKTFTKESPESNTIDGVLGAAGAIAYANGVLVIGDANRLGAGPLNPRIIVHRGVNQLVPSPTAVLSTNTDIRCPACLLPAGLSVGKREVVDNVPMWTIGLGNNSFRLPAAVATDGVRVAVADTDSNRVLLWNSLPTSTTQPADIVLGQPDFQTDCPNAVGPRNADSSCPGSASAPTAKSLRGPQGVWIHGNKLFVADDQNHRVLIWDPIPTQSFAPAQVVLGQPNFTTRIEPDLTQREFNVNAASLLNPVSVTTDGQRLFVSDLGHNRVLIWNSVPTQSAQPADIVVGQPDMTSGSANNASKLCASTGTNDAGVAQYPARCAATLDFPRFALSDGTRLFVADGGNDRVLVYNAIPQQNGAAANAVLGQINDTVIQTSDNGDSPFLSRRGAADAIRTPTSLAWDGNNLLVADPFARRVLFFTPADIALPLTGIRNAASLDVFAVGSVQFSGTITEGNNITIKINDKEYKYQVKKDETLGTVTTGVADLINAGDGDPSVIATPNLALTAVVLTSRIGGEEGNNTKLETSTSPSTTATILATASGTSLSGGQDAAKLGPGSLISIFGNNLADLPEGEVVQAPAAADPLPVDLAGVQVYVDGMRAPIMSVTRNQINAQLPFEVNDATSVTAWIRKQDRSGNVTATSALGIPVVPANPGIFTFAGTDPRPAVAMHGSSSAVGTVSIDGTPNTGEKVSITIEDRTYSYTLVADDTLLIVMNKLIEQINANDPKVQAFAAGQFQRIRLRARVPGTEGNGIPYSTKSEGSNVIMTATTDKLCCANVEGALITDSNPAVPGENIILYATGLGMVGPDEALYALYSGFTYKGPAFNKATVRMDALAGGKTANVLFMGMKPGTVGLYEVHLELLSDLPTNPKTQVTIAQDVYVSNIVTIPVFDPTPPEEEQ
ncbi:MAG TPA: hypothetical protein VN428_16660 [Bryobacteraceae bacterium]|nr:hypothetical protein [Bryobacteraceae bacterium]